MYIYPENLKSKPTLWLWELKDIGIIGIGCLISAVALAKLKFVLPLLIVAVYAFLTIRLEETSILDFIKFSIKYFFTQQKFEWGWLKCRERVKSRN